MINARPQAPAAHGVHDQRSEEDRRADAQLGPDEGLSGGDAAARVGRYGRNALEEQRRSVVLELLSHFWAPIPWSRARSVTSRQRSSRSAAT